MSDCVKVIENRCRIALARTCNKDGCKLLLDEKLPVPWALVDMDADSLGLQHDKPRCDYLFVADGVGGYCCVAPIELTRGRTKKAEQVKQQLQSGADLAARQLPESIMTRLIPVVAGRLAKTEREKIRKRKIAITFRGESEIPRIRRCGIPLSKALNLDA